MHTKLYIEEKNYWQHPFSLLQIFNHNLTKKRSTLLHPGPNYTSQIDYIMNRFLVFQRKEFFFRVEK